MEAENKPKMNNKKDNEIFYSKAIKAGKRIYYLDVKKSRNEDYYLAITESKKRITGQDDNVQVTYEKHKIFLYKEDFNSFMNGMQDVIDFIVKEQGEPTTREEYYQKNRIETTEEVKEEQEEEKTEEKKGFFDKFKF
ncbi:MAG: hypothetical protein CR965_02585 [Paludibacter sp.]|nr:MAG: hypothetical protein CR965_02585 [Paludibacter sp.]